MTKNNPKPRKEKKIRPPLNDPEDEKFLLKRP